MREIRFRAWDKQEKRMLAVVEIDFEDKIKNVYTDTWNREECIGWLGFREIELMQYTGLKDKNGKEIYEGDIVRIFIPQQNDYEHIFSVEWSEYDASFTGIAGRKAREYIEVIGNIYENKEWQKLYKQINRE